MAVSGTGTVWNLPNWEGTLYTSAYTKAPILNAISGRAKDTANFDFATSVEYALPAAAQPAITETAAVAGVTAAEEEVTQVQNTCQIFMEALDLSYVKLSNGGRMSAAEVGTSGIGYNTAGAGNAKGNEMDFQTRLNKIAKIARDMEYTIINGVYQQATSAGVAAKSRGIIAAATTTAIAAGAAALDKALLQQLFKSMADNSNGQAFTAMPMLLVNSFQKQKISDIYSSFPTMQNQNNNVGGVNVLQIETDFGLVGVMYHPFVPTDTVAFTSMEALAPVWNVVPGKGRLFEEELSKTGASEKKQLYGQFGLDHGPEWMHGKITGLAIA